MYEPSLLSKLMSPTLPPTVLYRQALVEELAQAITGLSNRTGLVVGETGYRVVLLCAPAGYGKTTLLADFARRVELPCCWYFLDPTDEDTISFFTRLIASFRQRFPQFDGSLAEQLRDISTIDNPVQIHQQLEIFIDKLTDVIAAEVPEHFALILCNYQEIDQNQLTNLLLNRFVQRMPPQCTLILESRSTPPLEFISLLARRQIVGLGSNRLRFSAQEIHALANLQHVELTDHEAELLERSFEGWIAGILLGTHLGGLQIPLSYSSENTSFVKLGREHLFEYLVKHVFARKSEAYHFLKEAAVLRQMTPDLCNALLNISDAASRLATLEKQGLFVTHYNTGFEHFFICHPILRDLLYDELQSLAPEHLRELHLRAAELFRGVQDDEAISHALAARAFTIAAQLIETMIGQQFAQGRLTTLAHWIDSLPSDVASQYPRLLLARANILLEGSTPAKVQNLLEQALAALENTQASPSLQAEIRLAQAKFLMQQGDYAGTQKLSRQALALLPAEEIELQATAHQLLGSCAAYFNNFTAGITELQQALQLCRHTPKNRQAAKLHTMLATFYGVTDQNALSEHHRLRAIQYRENLSDEWGRVDDLIGLGLLRTRQGALVEAEQIFTQALSISRGTAHYECGEAYVLANLGDIYQDQNRFPQALVAYEDGLTLSHLQDDAYLTLIIICQQARTYQLMGDPQSALRIIAQLEQTMSEMESGYSYEQAFYALTLGTILLHTGDLGTAYTYLVAAKSAFAETRYEKIRAMLQIAACLLAQDKAHAALEEARDAVQLASEYSYEALAQRELDRSPKLQARLKMGTSAVSEGSHAQEEISPTDIHMDQGAVSGVSLVQIRPVLRIQALGIPAVYKDGTLLKHWRMARSMEFFFLLLNASRSLHKEQIVTYLWRDGDMPADQTWRSTIHYLRKALDADCIKSRQGVCTLQLEPMFIVKYDVDDFLRHAAQARIALDREDGEAARQAFEKMIALYQGDFVSSFYSDWCAPRRDELRQVCIDAHRQLALFAWQQHQLEKCIFHWQHIVSMDNMLETAYEGLMRCYLQQGKRNQALRQYNHYATLLQDELNMTPGPTLQLLYQQIMHSSQLS